MRPWLRAQEPLCQSLKARVISKALPVRIARNPVSPGETGVNRQFKRIKGAIKDAAGELTGDEALEDKGERENAAGTDRQRRNDAV